MADKCKLSPNASRVRSPRLRPAKTKNPLVIFLKLPPPCSLEAEKGVLVFGVRPPKKIGGGVEASPVGKADALRAKYEYVTDTAIDIILLLC